MKNPSARSTGIATTLACTAWKKKKKVCLCQPNKDTVLGDDVNCIYNSRSDSLTNPPPKKMLQFHVPKPLYLPSILKKPRHLNFPATFTECSSKEGGGGQELDTICSDYVDEPSQQLHRHCVRYTLVYQATNTKNVKKNSVII